MKIDISSGKWLCQAKAMAANSSCKVFKVRTFHLDKMIKYIYAI